MWYTWYRALYYDSNRIRIRKGFVIINIISIKFSASKVKPLFLFFSWFDQVFMVRFQGCWKDYIFVKLTLKFKECHQL